MFTMFHRPVLARPFYKQSVHNNPKRISGELVLLKNVINITGLFGDSFSGYYGLIAYKTGGLVRAGET